MDRSIIELNAMRSNEILKVHNLVIKKIVIIGKSKYEWNYRKEKI